MSMFSLISHCQYCLTYTS